MKIKKVAISACLMGEKCRYDGTNNYNEVLLNNLQHCKLIPFCPEDHAFGTPRPTMDLVKKDHTVRAISNESGEDLTLSIENYAKNFFDKHKDIDLLIGKDRSPSCGVSSARLYNESKDLLSSTESGLMVKEAKRRHIKAIDSEDFKGVM